MIASSSSAASPPLPSVDQPVFVRWRSSVLRDTQTLLAVAEDMRAMAVKNNVISQFESGAEAAAAAKLAKVATAEYNRFTRAANALLTAAETMNEMEAACEQRVFALIALLNSSKALLAAAAAKRDDAAAEVPTTTSIAPSMFDAMVPKKTTPARTRVAGGKKGKRRGAAAATTGRKRKNASDT